MDRCTRDQKPAWTRIGDRQYHHFAFDVTAEQPQVQIDLCSDWNVDLHLYLSDQSLALADSATFAETRPGASKSIERPLTPGRWYVSVFCATAVDAIEDADAGFYRHVGNRSILNGVPYTIEIRR